MGLIDNIRQKGAEGRLTEEVLYAEVLREMEAGIRRDGLWAKALSEAGGAEAVAKAGYIKLRVQSLRDEVAIALSEHKKLVAQDAEKQRQAALTSNARMKAQAEEQKKREESERRAEAEEEWNRSSFVQRAVWILWGLFFWLLVVPGALLAAWDYLTSF